jgi:hypothetical protein
MAIITFFKTSKSFFGGSLPLAPAAFGVFRYPLVADHRHVRIVSSTSSGAINSMQALPAEKDNGL